MTTLPQILSLARTGSPGRAWSLFVSSGWADNRNNPKALTLKGRLLKDQAKATEGTEKVRLYGEAADAYMAAAEIKTDSYPLINGAALALLGGKPKRSAELARKTLDLIENDPNEGENAYWRDATRAEAFLLLGEETQARAVLSEAIGKLPNAWEDHAATIGQFALILNEQKRDTAWLDRHRPPPSIYFNGIIQLHHDDPKLLNAIERAIKQIQPGFAYGELAAGSDILLAEAFVKNKFAQNMEAELHITLPFPIEQFCELSVRPFGLQWVNRFEKLLSEAATVSIMGLDDPPLVLAVDLAEQIAMGRAIRNSKNLQSKAVALTICDPCDDLRSPLVAWQASEHGFLRLEGKRASTTAGEFESKCSNKTIGVIIWLENANDDLVDDILVDGIKLSATRNGHWSAFEDTEEGIAFARRIIATNAKGLQIGMLHGIINISVPSDQLLKQAELFAKVSQPDVVTTNHAGAMALTLKNTSRSIEEIGELKTAWGAQSLWRIL